MSLFNYDFTYWELRAKVTFDGINRLIIVNNEVASLDIRRDVYSEWVEWLQVDDNTKYLPAIRYSGLDPVPGGFTGDVYFLINGWKLVVNLNTVRITGVLYSDNYDTAYYSTDGNLSPQYPAVVSQLVSSVAVPTNTGISEDDLLNIATKVWGLTKADMPVNGIGEWLYKKVLTVARFIGLK